MFPQLFTMLSYKVGVEVGVQAGDFSDVIVKNWSGKLYLVDCWEFVPENGHDLTNVEDKRQEELYQSVLNRFVSYDRVKVIKAFSGTGAGLIDEELDFVYLDANHRKSSVQTDIDIWWPKLKRGGMLCGHDYLDGILTVGEFGVKSAVDEFAAQNSLSVHTTAEEWPSWLIIKP